MTDMTDKQQEGGSGAPDRGDENKLIAERREIGRASCRERV